MSDGTMQWTPAISAPRMCAIIEGANTGEQVWSWDEMAEAAITVTVPKAKLLGTNDYDKLKQAVIKLLQESNEANPFTYDKLNISSVKEWYLAKCKKLGNGGSMPEMVLPYDKIEAAYNQIIKKNKTELAEKEAQVKAGQKESAAYNEYLATQMVIAEVGLELANAEVNGLKAQLEQVQISCQGKTEETQEGTMYVAMELAPVLRGREIDHYETKPVQVQIENLPPNIVDIKIKIGGQEQTAVGTSVLAEGTIVVSFKMTSAENLDASYPIEIIATVKTGPTTTEEISITSKHYGVLVEAAEPKVVVVKERPRVEEKVKIIVKEDKPKPPKKGVCDGKVKAKYVPECNSKCSSKTGPSLSKCIGKYK